MRKPFEPQIDNGGGESSLEPVVQTGRWTATRLILDLHTRENILSTKGRFELGINDNDDFMRMGNTKIILLPGTAVDIQVSHS